MKTELPKEPGSYYWREKEGDEWEFIIASNIGDDLYFSSDRGAVYRKAYAHDWDKFYPIGLWLKIPTAEKILAMQDGVEAWAVFSEQCEFFWAEPELSKRILNDPMFTCEPVTIVRKAKR